MWDKKSIIVNILSISLIGLGYLVPRYGEVIKIVGFFAFSGAITNWLAIYMLFERIPLVYGSGIIPLQFEVFKKSIKAIIMEQFFNESNLNRFLNNRNIMDDPSTLLCKVVDTLDYEKIYDGLTEEILNTSLGKTLNIFGGAKALLPLKEPLIARIKRMLQEILAVSVIPQLGDEKFSHTIKEKIEAMIDAQLQELTPYQVKCLVKEMIEKYLGWIVVWGGVFGGAFGLLMEVIFKIK